MTLSRSAVAALALAPGELPGPAVAAKRGLRVGRFCQIKSKEGRTGPEQSRGDVTGPKRPNGTRGDRTNRTATFAKVHKTSSSAKSEDCTAEFPLAGALFKIKLFFFFFAVHRGLFFWGGGFLQQCDRRDRDNKRRSAWMFQSKLHERADHVYSLPTPFPSCNHAGGGRGAHCLLGLGAIMKRKLDYSVVTYCRCDWKTAVRFCALKWLDGNSSKHQERVTQAYSCSKWSTKLSRHLVDGWCDSRLQRPKQS